jgi:hypothetical protein
VGEAPYVYSVEASKGTLYFYLKVPKGSKIILVFKLVQNLVPFQKSSEVDRLIVY